jgi:terminase small subunit-like protein
MKRGPGRPSKFTPEIAALICERIALGETLRSICENEDMPAEATVRNWILTDAHGFFALSAHAYSLGYEALAEQCVQIADDAKNDWMERHGADDAGWIANGEHIQRSRLRIDTRMRLLGKWAPKRYGERTVLAGDPEAPLAVSVDMTGMSAADLRALAKVKLPEV